MCDASDPGLGGNWFPYNCVTTTNPEVVGWVGPDCNPIEYGYPSACSCWDDGNCVEESCAETNQCAEAAGESCSCDPNQGAACAGGRVCVTGACLKPCTQDADCGASMVCGEGGGCVLENGVPFAEQILYEMASVSEPRHSVASYALNKFEVAILMGAHVFIGAQVKLFKKWKTFTIFDWSDVFPLATFPFVDHQIGVQVDYQGDCTDAVSAFMNHQPEFVTRPLSVSDGAQASEFLDWCLSDMPNEVQNPDAPDLDEVLGDGVNDVFDFGNDLGTNIWQAHQLCIDGQVWYDYIASVEAGDVDFWDSMQCFYTHEGVTQDVDCQDDASLLGNTMLALDCLDINSANALPQVAALGALLQTSGVAGVYLTNYSPTYGGSQVDVTEPVLNPFAVIVDFEEEDLVTLGNINPQLAAFNGLTGSEGTFFLNVFVTQLDQCISDVQDGGRYDETQFEMVSVLSVEECDPCDLPDANPEECNGGIPQGACCQPDGSCGVTNQAQCEVVLVVPGPQCQLRPDGVQFTDYTVLPRLWRMRVPGPNGLHGWGRYREQLRVQRPICLRRNSEASVLPAQRGMH